MPPFTFLHLTDLHVPPPGETMRGFDAAGRLAATLAAVAARHGPGGAMPAAFAVVTGDLTRDSEPPAYAALREALAALPMPVHLMLGNHDLRGPFRDAFPEAPADPSGFVQQALPTPAGLCLMLDTLQEGRPEGRLCATRLGWLAARLAESAGPVLLFLHHPPMPVGIAGMDAIALHDSEALWQVLAPHRARIRQILHGHLHRDIAGRWRDIPIASHRGTAFEVGLCPDRGTVGVSANLPPCYALVRVTGHEVVVHTENLPALP